MHKTKMLAVQAYPAKHSLYIAQTGKVTPKKLNKSNVVGEHPKKKLKVAKTKKNVHKSIRKTINIEIKKGKPECLALDSYFLRFFCHHI